jgi:mannonate dehydratase
LPADGVNRPADLIASAEIIVTSPGRNFVTLKVVTESGVVGYGDGTLNGRELAVASYLRDYLCPLLIGRDVSRIEDTWQYFAKGAYWRRGPVTMTAIAAVDVALWDIKAKTAGMPLYQLLGGASRDAVRVYCHASGISIPELLDDVRLHLDQGYTAIRIQSGVPGLAQIYGIHAADMAYEPALRTEAPAEETWDSAAYLRHLPTVFEAVRHEFGDTLTLLHDAHHRLTPIEAARLGKDLEPYRPFWLEDCTPVENQDALRIVRQHTTTPLAIGEVFNSVHDCRALIAEQLIDYLRCSVTHTGGITALRKLLDFAALYGVRSGMHGPSDVSPVGMCAAFHLSLAVNNFGIQEYMPHPPDTGEVFHHEHTFRAGSFVVSDTPGLGIEVDEAAAASFEYQPAYLPVNRLADGTLHDW